METVIFFNMYMSTFINFSYFLCLILYLFDLYRAFYIRYGSSQRGHREQKTRRGKGKLHD